MPDTEPSPAQPPRTLLARALALVALLALLASAAWSSWAILTDRADFGARTAGRSQPADPASER